jgi:Peptidase U49
MTTQNNNYRVKVICDTDKKAGGIWPLIRLAPNTLETIAPERFNELLASLQGLTIHLKDSVLCKASALVDIHTITLHRGLVECLWCASYAYYAFLLDIESQIQSNTNTPHKLEITSNGNPQIASAMRALQAAITSAQKRQSLSWQGLPQPVEPRPLPQNGSLVAKAGEMTLTALGFIMHHELAHIRLGHHKGTDSQWTLEQEKDADSEAINWILSKAPMDSIEAVAKRTWGMVISTSFMTAIRLDSLIQGISPNQVVSQTHPQPYDRLDKAIQHSVIQDNNTLRTTMTSFACSALVPHIRIAELSLGGRPYNDWNELYDECLNVLSDALVH